MKRPVWFWFQVVVNVKVTGSLQNPVSFFHAGVLVTRIRENKRIPFRCHQLDAARRGTELRRFVKTAGSFTPSTSFLAHSSPRFLASFLFVDDKSRGKDALALAEVRRRVLNMV